MSTESLDLEKMCQILEINNIFMNIWISSFIQKVWFKKIFGSNSEFLNFKRWSDEWVYLYYDQQKVFNVPTWTPILHDISPFIPSFYDQIMLQNNCWKFHKSFWHHCWGDWYDHYHTGYETQLGPMSWCW